jgi:large subunit ribosomal protein L18Ae
VQFFDWFNLNIAKMVTTTNPLKHYVVVARPTPTKKNPAPKIYRMAIFAPNTVVAKSRTWYFLSSLRKLKRANGQIIAVNRVHEPITTVKNFGIWIRYVSRSGIHNMYKEYRDTKLTGAVHQMYLDMASRHRARFSTIHIVKTAEVANDKVKRANIVQFVKPDLKFPIIGKITKKPKKFKTPFSAGRPQTFLTTH